MALPRGIPTSVPLAQLGWGPRGERATGEGRAALEWRAEELGLVARGQ